MAIVLATLLVQLAVLIVQSRHQWQHFNLSVDFALFHQAWHQVGSGDLNPRSTLAGYSFWRSHFELIAWPLGLLGRLHRDDGLSMLYLQDLAVVGTEAVVLAWVWSATRQRRGGWPLTFTVPGRARAPRREPRGFTSSPTRTFITSPSPRSSCCSRRGSFGLGVVGRGSGSR
jgi:hypothetical protein